MRLVETGLEYWDPLGEHLAGLLCDPDEGGSPAELLQLGGTDVGAGGAEASEHVPDGVLHVPSVGDLHRPALRGPEKRHSQSGAVSTAPVGRPQSYRKSLNDLISSVASFVECSSHC